MNHLTHLTAGACLGAVLAPQHPALWALGAVGALLPDLDSPKTTIGRLVPPVSWLINKLLGWNAPHPDGHRGGTHSLLAVVAVSLLARHALGPTAGWVLAGGYVSHLLLDQLTIQGIRWLWPMPLDFRLPRPLAVASGHPWANAAVSILVVAGTLGQRFHHELEPWAAQLAGMLF